LSEQTSPGSALILLYVYLYWLNLKIKTIENNSSLRSIPIKNLLSGGWGGYWKALSSMIYHPCIFRKKLELYLLCIIYIKSIQTPLYITLSGIALFNLLQYVIFLWICWFFPLNVKKIIIQFRFNLFSIVWQNNNRNHFKTRGSGEPVSLTWHK
jgi:hypothetical protein